MCTFFAENDRSNGPLTFCENRMSGKIWFSRKMAKSGWGSWAARVQNERFPTYLEFGSLDFDETFRKCSWYKENED